MSYIDISIHGHVGTFTKRAKPHGVDVQIFLKVPKSDLTTVRLLAAKDRLVHFLHEHFADNQLALKMHLPAIKPGFVPLVPAKNRYLKEHRA
jgi:hypothetical protein